jgi:hypothetical protein
MPPVSTLSDEDLDRLLAADQYLAWYGPTMLVRTGGDPLPLAAAIRREATTLNSRAVVTDVTSMQQIQRTQEIGIRRALGATTLDAAWLVVGQAMCTTGIGLVLGIVAALTLKLRIRRKRGKI